MGNSTRTLQQIVDAVSTIGDLTPVLANTGGFASEPALTIANAAMSDLIAERFNFKWNRLRIDPFPLTSEQQDYPTVSANNIGWLETAAAVDVNSTSFPKPTRTVQTVREIGIDDWSGGPPAEVCWLPNSLLELSPWPGPNFVYPNPVSPVALPYSPASSIIDPNGVILTLSVYGATGAVCPVAPPNATAGTVIMDGTCAWKVCDPSAAGFRVSPRPAPSGNVWLMRIFAQAKPTRFTSLSQTLDPVPDDYSKYFEDGFIAYAHRHSADPKVKARYPSMKAEWMLDLHRATGQADRETEALGFYPGRTVMDSTGSYGPTVGNPTNMRRY